MKTNLLSFLFLESAEADAAEAEGRELNIAENLERLFEAAAEIETSELESKKTPLAKALGEFGIADSDLQLDPEGFCLVTDNRDRYNDILTVLGNADAMHKLAEMGWVVTKPGDDAMTNEPANYRVRFLEITTVDTGDKDKADEKVKAITKKAREFATTPLDRDDDDLNPVEADDSDKMGKKQTGVGKPKDGEDPEKAIHDSLEAGDVDKLVEMTTTGSMGTVEGGPQGIVGAGIIKKPKPYGKGTKFAMPGQWTVKQPIVNKQVKRKVNESACDVCGEEVGGNFFVIPTRQGKRRICGQCHVSGREKEIDSLEAYRHDVADAEPDLVHPVTGIFRSEMPRHLRHVESAEEFLKEPLPESDKSEKSGEKEEKPIKCPNCGKRHGYGTTWCPCGKDISDDDATQ